MRTTKPAAVRAGLLTAAVALTGAACSSDKGAQRTGTSTASGAGHTATQSQSTSRPAGSGITLPTAVIRAQGAVTMYVPVTIHGKKYYFDLDSGSSSTIIDATVAKSIGLKSVGSGGTLRTIGCTSKTGLVLIDGWSLGSKQLPSGKLVSRDTGFAKLEVKGVQVAGLLGADFQSGAGTVRADFTKETVTFGAPPAAAGGKSVALKLLEEQGGGVALVAPVSVGSAKLAMIVDTGASKTTISTSLARQLRLANAGRPAKVNAIGCAATVQPVLLAGAKVGDVPLPKIVAASSANGAPAKALAGLLGADVLSTFGAVTLDYKNSMMRLGG